MRPYRVLLVDLAQSFGGAEVRVLTQAKALQGRVALCAVAALKGSPLYKRLLDENIPTETLTLGRGNPRMALAMRDIIRRGKFQVIDAHNAQSIQWGHLGAALAGAKGIVSTIHSNYGKEFPGPKGWFYEGVLWFNRRIAREYITVTEVLQEKYAPYAPHPNSTLIHNAVPIPQDPKAPPDPQLRAGWGFAPDDFVVAIVARLKPVKGHRYLIEAMAQVQDLPQVKLLVVGEGPLQAALEAQVQRLGIAGKVHFAGFRRDIPDILRAVDCVCMASLSEALPYAVLEAGSYARPLLVTAVGGLATLLDDHQTALLVPSEDPDALAAGIRELATDFALATRLGQAAYELVQNSFSTEVMMDKVLQVYDRAAFEPHNSKAIS